MDRGSFEANLKKLIEINGGNKAEVARRVGVAPSTLTRWTDPSEKRELSAQHLLALARVLGVDPWVLLGSTFVEPLPAEPAPRRGRPPVSRENMDKALERATPPEPKVSRPAGSAAPRPSPKRGRA